MTSVIFGIGGMLAAEAAFGASATLLGISVVSIGGMVGSALGGVVDQALFGPQPPDAAHFNTPGIAPSQMTSAAYGRFINIAWGTIAIGSNIIESSGAIPVQQTVNLAEPGGGKKGGKK